MDLADLSLKTCERCFLPNRLAFHRLKTEASVDVLYFLQEHTKFIRNFHDSAVAPFERTQLKIRNQEEPFIPPYSEDGEPAFLAEWSEAETSIQVIGRTCISLLSNTFKLYLNTWTEQLGIGDKGKRGESPLDRFRRVLSIHSIQVDWSDCPAEGGIIEQMILARNREQHPEMIGTLSIQHDQNTLDKYPRPLFINPDELKWLLPSDTDWNGGFLINPSLHIARQSLEEAICAVEILAGWIEPQLVHAKYAR